MKNLLLKFLAGLLKHLWVVLIMGFIFGINIYNNGWRDGIIETLIIIGFFLCFISIMAISMICGENIEKRLTDRQNNAKLGSEIISETKGKSFKKQKNDNKTIN